MHPFGSSTTSNRQNGEFIDAIEAKFSAASMRAAARRQQQQITTRAALEPQPRAAATQHTWFRHGQKRGFTKRPHQISSNSIYDNGKQYPHPLDLYRYIPQCTRISWRVQSSFVTSIFFAVREEYFSAAELAVLRSVNKNFRGMVDDVPRLKNVDFSSLFQDRSDWASQKCIDPERIRLISAMAQFYGLDMGLVVRALGDEYTGHWRDVPAILLAVQPHVSSDDFTHIERVLTDGCPFEFDYEETHENKMALLARGNHASIDNDLDEVWDTMNDEERHNHVFPMFFWLVYFSAWAHHVCQSYLDKRGSKCYMRYACKTIEVSDGSLSRTRDRHQSLCY